MDNSILEAYVQQKNPNGIRGFNKHIRGMFVATFTLLLLYLLFLLAKYILNAFNSLTRRPASSRLGAGKGGGGWFASMRRNMATGPPPPPPMAPSQRLAQGQQAGAGGPGASGGMPGGVQGATMMPGSDMEKGDLYNTRTQGAESEIGTAADSPWSERLSRAADVSRLGFLLLLGGTVLNALSFDAPGASLTLAWIAFGFFVLWAFLALLSANRWIPLLLGFLTFPFVIAIYSLGFNVETTKQVNTYSLGG